MWRTLALWIAVGVVVPYCVRAESALVIKPLAEKSLTELPEGELFCRIENFRTLAQAKSAMGNWSLAAESVVDADRPFSSPATLP